ncbi:putative oxalocrotonate tautomerase [Aspergillus avenaceus]|uniref:Putative oxalocrotonate tautomerase n=1 Tax=Aspergillus avenaceus TaxID=36643 RepID=A0A5N6TYD5_ASPAV|nr:putative oxalocrotonate tautomerase [Aspergillus avenaceus]
MPRWTFELTPDMLSATEKQTLAQQITATYTEVGIPGFLVNMFFHENRIGCFFSGGKTPPNTVFFVIDHAARTFPSEEVRLAFIARINKIVRPILAPKNIKWEYNIYEHPRDNWRVNGMVPPVDQKEAWGQWMDQNTAVPYGHYVTGSDEDDSKLKL